MKQVLIIDASPIFREFLKEKFSAEKIDVEVADGRRDAFTKLLSLLPDLVILDIETSIDDMQDFLDSKKSSPNTVHIPMIITGPKIDRNRVGELIQYGVAKYFNKPIKFDAFFEAVGKILRAPFAIDPTPCVLEAHLNDDIIFVEIAQGLNREKISLLKYKLAEIIDMNSLEHPKVILMMTDLSLSFVDGLNLELLIDNVIFHPEIENRNVKILSLDSFVAELIDGHPMYSGIEVVNNLNQVLTSVVHGGINGTIQDLITDKILSSSEDVEEGSVAMRFDSDPTVNDEGESSSPAAAAVNSPKAGPRVALIDPEELSRRFFAANISTLSPVIDQFANSSLFLGSVTKVRYDLVVLDLLTPGVPSFDLLKLLRTKFPQIPVIIYASARVREYVVQALNMGAKAYVSKPCKGEEILQKVSEVLKVR